MKKSFVQLSIAEYDRLAKLESARIQELEKENSALMKIVDSDFTVRRLMLDTLYFKKSEGLEYSFDWMANDFAKLSSGLRKKLSFMKFHAAFAYAVLAIAEAARLSWF